MKGRRWLQPLILVIGMAGLAFAVAGSVDDAQEQVLPSIQAIAGASVLAMIAIVASARTWAALFNDVLDTKSNRVALHGTFYLSQLTKYLPGGGVVQAASQLSLAPSAGVPMHRVALAFPVSAVCAVVAGATLGSGLVFDGSLPDWTRALVLLGLLTPVFLHRKLMAAVLGLARRVVHRIPHPDRLPTQADILRSYAWALLTVGCLAGAYAVLLDSLTAGHNPLMILCAYALSWMIGFLAIPIPAGVGVREALLVALLPGVGTAPVVAASLALRLIAIGTELVALGANKVIARRHPPALPGPEAENLIAP
ncbi:MAG: lysylphosphatidylglycerol synthase domain-containing protein [Acidimicrobiia bacterium]